MKSRILAGAALVAASALAMTGCSAPAADAPAAAESTGGAGSSARGELLTLGILQEPASWDPAQAHVGHRLQPFQAAYDTLILREADGSYAPMLATEWGYTDETMFDGAYTVAPGDDHVRQSKMRSLRGKRISYIPQEPMSNLDPAFTIGSQLSTPMVRVLGVTKAEARQRALELLASVGIPDPQRTFNAYPHEVSGGMAQRVLIAGAISCEPDLIIADEPTTALDVTVQAEVLDVLRELQRKLGLGIIMVTHNFGVVADICDRVLVMQNGRLVEDGPVRQILGTPQHPYTQMLLSSMLEGKQPMTPLLGASSTTAPDAPMEVAR